MRIEDIYAAKDRIGKYIYPTPLLHSPLLSHQTKKEVWLKLETQQLTGSFKIRPALNSILCNLEQARQAGVVASSSGNFAQGVAYAARLLQIKAMIVMPDNTLPYKIERTKKLGAEVVLCENSQEARISTTTRIQQETGRVLLHPYDSIETVAGDGTIGLELSNQLIHQMSCPFSILVPVSGGGLVAGIASAIKSLHPQCKVIGLQSVVCGSLLKSLKAKHLVNVPPFKTVADALVATEPGKLPFEIAKQYVDDVIVIEEEAILKATGYMIEEHKLVVEPASALTVAALLNHKISGQHVICIISGGNIPLWKP